MFLWLDHTGRGRSGLQRKVWDAVLEDAEDELSQAKSNENCPAYVFVSFQMAFPQAVFLINDWRGKSSATLGRWSWVAWEIGLSKPEWGRDQASKKLSSSVVTASIPALGSCPDFLSDGLWCGSIKQINPFVPKLLWVLVFLSPQKKAH